MAATTNKFSAARAGLFSFVKLSVLIPACRWKLFVQLFALGAAPSTVLYLAKSFAVKPLTAAIINLESQVVGGTDAAFAAAVLSFLSEHRRLLQASAGCLVALSSATKIANILASIMASTREHEHEPDTLVYFLGRLRRNLWGPVTTASLGYVLQTAYVGATFVSALPLFIFAEHYPPLMLILHVLLLLAALLFFVYLKAVCAVSVVASVAEPGLHGLRAVRRTWRLMRGNGAQAAAVLYVASTWALGRAASPLYRLATAWLPYRGSSVVLVPVDTAIMHLLVAALDVFSVAAVTAYYLQCRKSAKDACCAKSNEDAVAA